MHHERQGARTHTTGTKRSWTGFFQNIPYTNRPVEELFNVEIKCDSKTYEYYIDDSDTHNEGMTDWLLNTAAVNTRSSVIFIL